MPPLEEYADLPGFNPECAHPVAPGQRNCRRRFMEASLAPAHFSVRKLICHSLRTSGVPLHVNLGCIVEGINQEDLELIETPHLRPRCSSGDFGRPQVPRHPGQDHVSDGPLGEGSPRSPGGGRRGRRGRQRGQGRLKRKGGGWSHSKKIPRHSAV